MSNIWGKMQCPKPRIFSGTLYPTHITTFDSFSDPPEVSVELGSKLNAVDIREGDDVYFECTIDAFPSAERISWKKDVSRTHYSLYFSTKATEG